MLPLRWCLLFREQRRKGAGLFNSTITCVLILAPAADRTETFAIFLAHRCNRDGEYNRLANADCHVKLRTSVVNPFNIIRPQNNILFIIVWIFTTYVYEVRI